MIDNRLPSTGYTPPVKHACIRCGKAVNGNLYLLCDECRFSDRLEEVNADADRESEIYFARYGQ